MTGARLLAAVAWLICSTGWAASSLEVEAAFAKARKKGGDVTYHERCGADRVPSGGLVFNDDSAIGVLKAAGSLAAMAAIQDQGPTTDCSAGMLPGEERYFELDADGIVRTTY